MPPNAEASANLWKNSEPVRRHAGRPLIGELRLAMQQDDAGGRQAGAADEHDVRRSPQGDVLTEQPVPDVVEREPDQGVEAARGDEDATDRRVPVAGDPDRGDTWLRAVPRVHDRGHAGDEQGEEPVEDQVVSRVGQWSGVATTARVVADVPEEAEQRDDQGAGDEQGRDGRPSGFVAALLKAFAEVLEPLDAVRAVGPGDPEQAGGDDGGADRETDDLVECGASRRGRFVGEEKHTRSMPTAM